MVVPLTLEEQDLGDDGFGRCCVDNRSYNTLLTAARAIEERANAELERALAVSAAKSQPRSC